MVIRKRLRRPAVAGYFYPGSPEGLKQELTRVMVRAPHRIAARGVIVPHAGWRYSGAVAGETFGRVVIPRRCVLLGPNHTGVGPGWSLMAEGGYQTPLGEVPIDEPLAAALLGACPLLVDDEQAHAGEHAIEVELPFLQWGGPDGLSIVPILVGSPLEEEYDQVAGALARVIRAQEEPVLLLASSDFTHYEPREVTTRKDAQLIEAVLQFHAARFLQRMRELHAAMCGYGPVACVLGAAKRLGASQATLVRYATSADAGGDPHSTVGYAGIILN